MDSRAGLRASRSVPRSCRWPARTPTCAAMTAMTLDAMSGGRFVLGIGPSGPGVVEGWHGAPYGRPLTRTREYICDHSQDSRKRGETRAHRLSLSDSVHRRGGKRFGKADEKHPARRSGAADLHGGRNAERTALRGRGRGRRVPDLDEPGAIRFAGALPRRGFCPFGNGQEPEEFRRRAAGQRRRWATISINAAVR